MQRYHLTLSLRKQNILSQRTKLSVSIFFGNVILEERREFTSLVSLSTFSMNAFERAIDVSSFRKDRDLPPRPRRYGWGDNEKDVSEQKTQTFPQRLQAAAPPPQQQQRHVKEIVREWGFQDKKTAKLLLKRRKRMMKGKKKNMQQHKERRRLKRRVGHMMRTQDERRIRQRDRHRLPKLVSPTVSVSSSGSGSSGSTISRSRNRTPPRTSQSWAGSEKRRQRKESLTRCIHESNAIKNRLMGNARRFLLDEDDDDEFSLPPISRSR